ncbi:hypothetical protein K474DRAFT_1505289 [Panus rudis PR-1116 ss-1]|nr:hypothetical protein K474DRAFT_1505289 [Panus rudis PR-1116 ss-1]
MVSRADTLAVPLPSNVPTIRTSSTSLSPVPPIGNQGGNPLASRSAANPIAIFGAVARAEGRQESMHRTRELLSQSSTQGAGHSRHTFPSSSQTPVRNEPAKLKFIFMVLLITFDIEYQGEVNILIDQIVIRREEVPHIKKVLESVGLAFTIEVVDRGEEHLWKDISDLIISNLHDSRLSFAPSSKGAEVSDDLFESLPFNFYFCSSKLTKNTWRKLKPASNIMSWSVKKNLQSEKDHFSDPTHKTKINIIAPRYNHMSAPIDGLLDEADCCFQCSHLPHACFGFRVMHKLQLSYMKEIEFPWSSFLTCDVGTCPPCLRCGRDPLANDASDSEYEFPSTAAALIASIGGRRTRSASNSTVITGPPASNRPRLEHVPPQVPPSAAHDPLPEIASLLPGLVRPVVNLPAGVLPQAASATSGSNQAVDVDERTEPKPLFDVPTLPSTNAVVKWQDSVKRAATVYLTENIARVEDSDDHGRLTLHGETEEIASCNVLSVVRSLLRRRHKHSGNTDGDAIDIDEDGGDDEEDIPLPQLQSYAQSRIPHELALLSDITEFFIGRSVGDGVRESILHAACERLLSNLDYWDIVSDDSQGTKYYVPIFLDITDPVRELEWEVTGTVIAASLVWSGSTLVSPFVIMALLSHGSCLQMSKEVVALFDVDAAATLAPWLDLGATEAFSTQRDSSVSQFLYSVERQPGTIARVRQSEDTHWGLTSMFLCQVLLKRSNFFNSPEFVALQRGFNLRLGAMWMQSKVDIVSCFHEHAKTNVAVAELVAAMYRRVVLHPDDVVPHLYPLDMRKTEATDLTKHILDTIFVRHLERYLRGKGHPTHPRLLERGIITKDEMEAEKDNLTLRTKLLLRAATPAQLIPMGDDWQLTLAFRDFHVKEDEEPVLAFHTCSKSIDIFMGRRLIEVLMHSVPKNPLDDMEATRFDIWLHSILMMINRQTNNIL